MPRYNSFVSRVHRAIVALGLCLAFAGAPILAAQCEVTCETQPAATGAATTGAHHHHHGAQPSVAIAATSQSCGHDHNGVLTVDTAGRPNDQTLALIDTAAVTLLPYRRPPFLFTGTVDSIEPSARLL